MWCACVVTRRNSRKNAWSDDDAEPHKRRNGCGIISSRIGLSHHFYAQRNYTVEGVDLMLVDTNSELTAHLLLLRSTSCTHGIEQALENVLMIGYQIWNSAQRMLYVPDQRSADGL